jgi:tight adherence protein B
VSAQAFWFGRVAALAVLVALAGGGWLLFDADSAPARRWLSQHERELANKLRFLRARLTAKRLLLGQGLVSLMSLIAAAGWQEPTLLAVLIPVLFLPSVLIEQRVAKRASTVEEQIEAWLNAVANALRASPSLGEAMTSSIALVPAPLSEEVDVLVKEYELGTPLDRALDHLAARVPSKTLAGTTLALKVARRTGGNLPAMLESAAVALRELARLEGVVRTKTAEGKAQAFVIGAIPVPLVLLVRWSDPHFFDPLFGTFTGKLVIAGALALWALAILVARKILQVDI